MAVFLYFLDTAEFGMSAKTKSTAIPVESTAEFGIFRKDKKHRHSGESRNLFYSIPVKAGIELDSRFRGNGFGEIPAFAGMVYF